MTLPRNDKIRIGSRVKTGKNSGYSFAKERPCGTVINIESDGSFFLVEVDNYNGFTLHFGKKDLELI